MYYFKGGGGCWGGGGGCYLYSVRQAWPREFGILLSLLLPHLSEEESI